jgi:hypothetical protein
VSDEVTVHAEDLAASKRLKGGSEMQSDHIDSDPVVVSRVRPVSWKLFVQGETAAEYVRGFLSGMRMDCSEPVEEPELHDTAILSFVVTPSLETPLTAQELIALLQEDDHIVVAFDPS